jgi:hypothetical protein
MRLEKGMLIMSVDVDVGSKELAVINKGMNDVNVSRRFGEFAIGAIEERVLPQFVNLINSYEMPVTFAIRGQLTEVPHSILEILLESSVRHDIGAHGYYHRKFEDLSYSEAENEMKLISHGMQRLGVVPRSFVFPKNSVAHLKLLEKYGYECYRGYGDFMNDSMYIEKCDKLWDVHPSLCIDQHTRFAFLKKILNIAIEKKLPCHLWFHLWNFGQEECGARRNLEKVFAPILDYAKRKERDGMLMFETMLSATRKARADLDL